MLDVGKESRLIFAVGLHSHDHGTKIVVKLVNETNGEEQIVAQDQHYNNNMQVWRYMKKPIALRHGHRIDVECTYNTMDMDKPLLNGRGTNEEMCLVFLAVYPSITVRKCFSSPLSPWSWGADTFGWNVLQKNGSIVSPVFVGGRIYNNVPAYQPLLNKYMWENRYARVRSFERAGEIGRHMYQCTFNNGSERSGQL